MTTRFELFCQYVAELPRSEAMNEYLIIDTDARSAAHEVDSPEYHAAADRAQAAWDKLSWSEKRAIDRCARRAGCAIDRGYRRRLKKNAVLALVALALAILVYAAGGPLWLINANMAFAAVFSMFMAYWAHMDNP